MSTGKSELIMATERFERARLEYDEASAALRELVRKGFRHAQQVTRPAPLPIKSDDVKTIIAITAAHHGFAIDVVMGRHRSARVANARQQAMIIIRELLDMTFVEVGRLFKRDHGTVIWAVSSIRERCELEPTYSADFDVLLAKCAAATKQVPPK